MRSTSIQKTNSGYTIVELMVVMGISGMLVVLGTYDFTAQTSRRRLRRTSHEIVSHLRLVRQKAIAEGKTLSIEFIPDEGQYNLPGLGVRTLPQKVLFGAEDYIQKTPGDENNKPPTDGISFNNDRVTFQPNGTYAGVGGTIYLMNASPQPENVAITVNVTGRVRLYKWSGDDWE